MDRSMVPEASIGTQSQRSAPEHGLAHLFLGLSLVQFGLIWAGHWAVFPRWYQSAWAAELLLVSAVISTLSSLARSLPWQNVLLAAALGFITAAAVEGVRASIVRHLGPEDFSGIFHTSRTPQLWRLAMIWLVAILNCRGVARMVLRRWRFAPGYGFWVLGCTVGLSVLFVMCFAEFGPFAFSGFPQVTRETGLEFKTAKTLLGCAGEALVILLLVTPSLINKRPAPEYPDWHPLVMWGAFNLWFLLSAAKAWGT